MFISNPRPSYPPIFRSLSNCLYSLLKFYVCERKVYSQVKSANFACNIFNRENSGRLDKAGKLINCHGVESISYVNNKKIKKIGRGVPSLKGRPPQIFKKCSPKSNPIHDFLV